MVHRRQTLPRHSLLELSALGGLVGGSEFVVFATTLIVASANIVTKKEILTALPLLWLGRQKSLILICPSVVFVIFAVRDLKVRLTKFSFFLRHVRHACRSMILVIVWHASYTTLEPDMSVCYLSDERGVWTHSANLESRDLVELPRGSLPV